MRPTPAGSPFGLGCDERRAGRGRPRARRSSPRSGPSVHLTYRSRNVKAMVLVSESPAANRGSVYDEIIGPDPWPTTFVGDLEVHIGGTGLISRGGQAQAYLEREGTFVFLMSETLIRERLAELAGSLVRVASAEA